ncbi:MAG: type IV toxin-antitoxin system AbiEi family antitoxin domain-containing protein [Chitinispirillaceae bacterium]|nr:type IV toxin-antitoxin system AbiEi family antitoxin domain-containing protein [Chitinispirillaceae bacterium]
MKNPIAEQQLYEIASSQGGYFTAQQAVFCGYIHKNHHYYVKNGDWIKELRGIYRLSRYPEPDDSQYILWSLWSCDRNGKIRGVYSHETALSMFELSDVNPDKLHMSVPPDFRKSAAIPEILILHKKTLHSGDCEQRMGYSVLKPLPTILMLIEECETPDDILVQALKDGINKGYFIKSYMQKLKQSDKVSKKLNTLLMRL